MIPRIVYVDDHPVRDPLSLTLELKGYQIATARNGAECIELAHSWIPHFILMDLRMPRMDGFEAIKILRQDSRTANIPIFVLSAWTTKQHRERAFSAGANEFFAKPVDLNRLLRTLNSYFEELPLEAQSSTIDASVNLQTLESVGHVFNRGETPYIAGPPVIDPKMFFGREQILSKIINTLHNNNIMLTGPRRIGKTSLLYQLKNRLVALDDPNYFFAAIFIDVQGVRQEDFFHTVMDEIVTALSGYLSEQAMPALDFKQANLTYTDRTFGKDLGKIIKALQQTHPNKTVKLVLLMDEMDVMNSYDQRVQSQLRSIFQKDFAPNLAVVVAGVGLRQVWERYESPFYNMFTPLVLEPFTPEQARELIIKPVEGLFTYDEATIQRILTATGRHPFRLQQLCLEITQRVAEAKQQDITLDDVEATLATIHWIEEESTPSSQEAKAQLQATPNQVLAEKRALYNPSGPPHQNEEAE